MKHALAILLCMLASLLCVEAQVPFTVMEYNCENVFDTIHDEGKDDYEFLKDGERHWRRWQLTKKLRGIAKVIAATNEHRPVDLIGLCEVENDSVMTRLTRQSALAPMGYQYVMTNSNDRRGIDVALMYSPFTFHPFDTQSISPPQGAQTRDILRVSGTIVTGDTLDVYVAHLPSKLGGAEAYKLSCRITESLIANIDSVLRHREQANVIVMGDFNAEAKSQQIRRLTHDTPLVDVTARVKPGTYKYQGKWTVIDHVLCYTTSLRHIRSQVLTLPQLLEDDQYNGGVRPRRTFLGTYYKGGLSDHLPLVVKFVQEKR